MSVLFYLRCVHSEQSLSHLMPQQSMRAAERSGITYTPHAKLHEKVGSTPVQPLSCRMGQ